MQILYSCRCLERSSTVLVNGVPHYLMVLQLVTNELCIPAAWGLDPSPSVNIPVKLYRELG